MSTISRKTVTIVSVCVIVAALLLIWIWPTEIYGPTWTQKARRQLEEWHRILLLAKVKSGQAPPTTAPELIEWLFGDHGIVREEADTSPYSRISADRKHILDPWDNPIVLMVQDGALVALGSAGPNGQWENGEKDDIIAELVP